MAKASVLPVPEPVEQAFREAARADRLLCILQILACAPGGRTNSRVLADALERLGHPVASAVLAVDLAWLAEFALLRNASVDSMTVACLVDDGLAVARGLVRLPGIGSPVPGGWPE